MKISKKILSMIMVLLLVVGMLPMSVFATETCTCNVHCTDALILETSCAFCRASGDPNDCKGTDTLEGGEFTYQGIVYKITDKYNHDVSVKDGKSVTGNVTIPSKAFNGDVSYTVTKIDAYAFQGNSSLTGITIPDSVTEIGGQAFMNCFALESIDIPNSVSSIGPYTFAYCGLESVNLPYGLTGIGDCTFLNCSSLKTVTIPSSVESIGKRAFYECSQLTTITIPWGVVSIGQQAFAFCESLTSITIPNSVTEIGVMAFLGCKKLSSVVLPSALTSIGDGAFQRAGLTSITIPASVTAIGQNAFRYCSSLQTVLLMTDSPKTIADDAFSDTSATITHKYVAPGNLRWDGTTLRWDALNTGYVRYKVDAKQLESPSGIVSKSQTYYVTGGSCDLSSYLSSGTYEIRLTAVEPEVLDNSYPHYESSDTITLELKYPHQVEISDIQTTRTGVDTASVSFNTSMAGTMYYRVTDMRYNTNPSISTDGEGTPVPQGYFVFDLPLVGGVEPRNPQYLYVTFKTADGVVSDVTRIEIDGYSGTTYKLTVTAGENGKIDPGSHYIEEGRSVTFTITPDSGYKLNTLTLDGEDVTSAVVDNQYTLTNVTAIHTIAATWVEDPATHIHDLSYSKYGPFQIIQTCTGCSHEATATLRATVVSSASIYDGETDFSPTVEYSAGWIGTQPEPVCFKDDKQVNESIDVGEYTARLTVSDVTAEMVYSVTKRIPTVSVKPTVSQIVVGNVLSSVVLNGGDVKGVGGTSIEGEFDWSEPAAVMDTLGNQTVKVTFTPDSNNYESVEFNIDVNVVNCDTASGEHDFTEWENNDTEHWLVCAKCEAEKPGSREAHKGGTATCQAKANCSECGEEYGDYGAHNWEADWTTDSEKHWHKCLNTGCTEINKDDPHSGGSATCKELAKCEFCGMAYGALSAHGETEVRDAKDAACTAEGYTGDIYCKVCGEKLETGTAIAKTAHTYKDGKCTACKEADPDYNPDVPQTGDDSHLILWLALMIVSGLSIAVLAGWNRKKTAC